MKISDELFLGASFFVFGCVQMFLLSTIYTKGLEGYLIFRDAVTQTALFTLIVLGFMILTKLKRSVK